MNRLALTRAATEPLRATLLRTVPLALVIGTVATVVLRGMPASAGDWRQWLARAAAALWITLGGHTVESLYLHRVLPYVASEHEARSSARWFMRLAARCAVWAVGGALLWVGGVSTYWLIVNERLPRAAELPAILLQGAVGLVVIELLGVHVILTIIGQPSAWMRRNGRWG